MINLLILSITVIILFVSVLFNAYFCKRFLSKYIYVGDNEEDGEYRVVLIINNDLKMQKGKVISQCMHGLDGILDQIEYAYSKRKRELLMKKWRANGSCKLVLKASEDQLKNIHKLLREKEEINYFSVYDAGRTQVPSGSNTVLAVGPATKEQLDEFTKYLKLY
ncbi:hypothetical protein NUSPORA_01924 [Nucleospora cyclopteri]